MLSDVKTLPDDPALLKGLIASLASELTNRDVLIAKLQHQLSGLRRHQFGARSEAIDQLELTLEEQEIARAVEAPAGPTSDTKTGKQQPKRRPLPENLPRQESILSPGEACTSCGGKLRGLGRDVTEELEYVPGRFVVNRYVRPVAWQAMYASPRRAYGLRVLRTDRASAAAVSPHRTGTAWTRIAGARAGRQIR